MQAHPATELFPMMPETELRELAADIKANGQHIPIVVHQGKILDGRNRWVACEIAGIEPKTTEWMGRGSPTAWVISLNLHRRHLTPSQRAAIAVDALPVLEDERRKSQGKRTDLTCVKDFTEVGKPGRATEDAAALFGVSHLYVSDAKKIKQEAPDLYESVRQGEASLQDAKRELKEREREKVRDYNRELVTSTTPIVVSHKPQERYQTIVLDPPWDWGDEGDADQFGRARPTYATMTIDEIAALPIKALAQDNAHIYLWITNRSLPKGFALLETWGFRYITCLTWCKSSIGMGNYFRGSTEQILFGVRGSLPLLRRDIGTHFAAARPGLHSQKPYAFYDLVEVCSPGPWLEVFSRRPRPGWTVWGAEVSVGASL